MVMFAPTLDTPAVIDAARDHSHELVYHRDAVANVNGDHRLSAINRALAVGVTHGVGSMWCAYVFFCLACISAPAALSTGNTLVIVQWLSGTLCQLVLLPIIIVGQNVEAEVQDRRAETDHTTLNQVHTVGTRTLEIQNSQVEILNGQDQILAEIRDLARSGRPTGEGA